MRHLGLLSVLTSCILLLSAASHTAAEGVKELTAERYRTAGVDVFVVAADDSIEHLWQLAGGTWKRASLGGVGRDIASIKYDDGSIELFVVGSDAAVWHNRQRTPGGAWSGWNRAVADTREVKHVAAARNRAGRVELFVVGNDDAVWRSVRPAKAKEFGAWETLGGVARQLSAAEAEGDVFRVFVVGNDDAIWTRSSKDDVWESLTGSAKDVSAVRLADGGHDVFVVGSDDALWRVRRAKTGARGEWERVGGSVSRVAMNRTKSGALDAVALQPDGTLLARTQAKPQAAWKDGQPLRQAGPLDTRFTGTTTVTIPELNVSETRAITLGVRFSADRSTVQITEFPPVVTKRFKTPFGSSKSTVTQLASKPGNYDAATGRIAIPITLGFDQSLDVPVVEEDAQLPLELTTAAEEGSPLDTGGRVTLVGNGKFRGKGNVNPLNQKACHVVISGVLEPVPARTGTR